MKLLQDILYRSRIEKVQGSTHVAISSLHMNSGEVKAFGLFAAIKGSVSDGHQYIEQAIEKGAIAIVCETLPNILHPHVSYVAVKNSAESLGHIAANFYDNPSESLSVVAITGTNGKTTTTTLLYDLFRAMGEKTGLLSTIVNKIDGEEIPTSHTTPDAITLQRLLRQMVDKGCTYCFMEASSHAIHQHRITGMKIKVAVFSNITHDHLDYHLNFNAYLAAKKALFDRLSSDATAIINVDDLHGEVMVQNCPARIKTYGLRTMADYKSKIIENQFNGLHLQIDGAELYTKLIGAFNAYNLTAAYATAMELGKDRLEILTALSALNPVQGRFQHYKTKGNITAVIDYAHTPDALENVLKTIQEIRTGNENIITVVGCGGDRDKKKRPIMAAISAEKSDKVILTSDNPRSEAPEQIIRDMQAGLDPNGVRKTISLPDRREAIKLACTMANPGDIILIAGKGHETYQDIKGVKSPFDDYKIALETLQMLDK